MDLDCGIPRARIVAWLDNELALPAVPSVPVEQGRWIFRAADGGETCRIALEPLGERTLGGLSLERTRLRADGDEGAVAAFARLFTLRFASAGG